MLWMFCTPTRLPCSSKDTAKTEQRNRRQYSSPGLYDHHEWLGTVDTRSAEEATVKEHCLAVIIDPVDG